MLPTGLATLTLLGCGQRDANEVAREEVMRVIDQATRAQTSTSALDAKDRVYTVASTKQGIDIPADFSSAATQLDRRNALVDELEAAAGPAGPLQQYSIARTLADIHRSNASYLAARAQDSFSNLRSQMIHGQSYAQRLQWVNAQLSEINGDRTAVINTFENGELGGDYPKVEGVAQLRERAAEIQTQVEKAQARYAELAEEVQALDASRLEHDGLELTLKNEASSLSGDARFDKMDQSIRAWQQARIDEAVAEEKVLLAKAEFYSTGLVLANLVSEDGRLSPQMINAFNTLVDEQRVDEIVAAFEAQPDLAAVNGTIAELTGRIEEVRTEIRALDAARREATTAQAEHIGNFNDMLTALDAHVAVLTTQRYNAALESVVKAEETLAGATPPPSVAQAHGLDLLTTYLLHVRIQHDQLVALETYQTLLGGLAANGPTVLGQDLADRINELAAGADEPIQALRAEAALSGNESLRQTVTAHLETLRAGAADETPEATQIDSLGNMLDTLWQNMQASE